jgi:hypothetical protein
MPLRRLTLPRRMNSSWVTTPLAGDSTTSPGP